MAEDFKTGNTYVSPEEKAMGVYSPANLPATDLTGTAYAPQVDVPIKNFENNLTTDFSQIPSPLLDSVQMSNDVYGKNGIKDFLNAPVTQAMEQATINTAARANQAPLSPEQVGTISGKPFVDPNLQGTANSIAAPPVANMPIENTQTVADTSKIVNPFGGSLGTAMLGVNQAEKAGLEKAVAESAYFQKKADIEQQKMDEQQKLQETFEFNYQNKMDDYTQSIKDFKALAGDKVIPGAFLARQDTQGSIMTGLAVALGGIGGALQGTNKNIGLEMIEKAIDKDVAAQQFNMQYKYNVSKANIDDQSSLLNKMREKFGDEKSAVLATKNAMLAMVQDQMNAELTKKGGATDLAVKSQANAARSAIMQKREQYEMQLKAAQAQQFEKQQMMQNVDYYNMSNEQALQSFGKDADKYVKGYGMATDPQLAKDFIQKVKPMADTVRKLKDTMTQVDKLSKWNFTDRQALESIMTDLQLTLKDEENYKLGVLTGPDMDLLQKVTGDPTSLSPIVNTKARLMQTLKNLEKKMDNKIENYGFTPNSKKPGNIDSLVKKN
jgi:putative NADH-flavin reductase